MGQSPATKHADELGRETADHVVPSGGPIAECRRGLGPNSKTVNMRAARRQRKPVRLLRLAAAGAARTRRSAAMRRPAGRRRSWGGATRPSAEPAAGSDGMPLAARSLPVPCPKS